MSERSVQVPTMDDLAALQAQVDDLDARVTALEQGGTAPPEPDSAYTFEDQFSGLELWNRDRPDASLTWRPTRWYSDDEWSGWDCNAGRMVNPYAQPGTASLYGVNSDNQLYLGIERTDASHGDCKGAPFVTSQINQLSFKQKGGYWEARIKCPNIRGTNCAFWLMNDHSWPPEVDILELVTFDDGSAVMSQNLWDPTDNSTNPYYQWSFDRTAWHTVGVYWDVALRRFQFFMDGAHTMEVAQPEGYDHGMFVILSMQQGGDWSGPTPDDAAMGAMLIDYVRISKQLPGALHSAPQAQKSGKAPLGRRSRGLGSGVRQHAV